MWTLENSLGFNIAKTARSLKRALDAKLVEFNLTSSQYIVLSRLFDEDGIKHSELGERLNLDNPTLTGIVDRMERDGLLRRVRDKNDRRAVRVYITKSGKDLFQKIDHFAHETDDEAWNGFTPSQRKIFLNNLNRIWKRLNGKSA